MLPPRNNIDRHDDRCHDTQICEEISISGIKRPRAVRCYGISKDLPCEESGRSPDPSVTVDKPRYTGIGCSYQRFSILYRPENRHTEVLVRTGCLAKPSVIGYRNDKIAPIGKEFSHQAGKNHLITD
jgi:hypothetical protein